MTDFIYEIDTIIPSENIRDFPVFIDLDYRFAVKARETEMPERILNNFLKSGKNIIQKFGLNQLGIVTPYHFVKKSWLLHFCAVPGDACDLGLSNNSQTDFLEYFDTIKEEPFPENARVSYSPHNVDTKDQAFCLLNLWLHWANNAKLLLI